MNANKGGNVVRMFSDEREPVKQERRRGRLPRGVIKLVRPKTPEEIERAEVEALERKAAALQQESRVMREALVARQQGAEAWHRLAQTTPHVMSMDEYCHRAGIPPEQRQGFQEFAIAYSSLPEAGREAVRLRIEVGVELMKRL